MPSGTYGRKGAVGASMTTHTSPKVRAEIRRAAAAASRRKSPKKIYYSQKLIDSEVARLRSEGKFKEAATMANTRSAEAEAAAIKARAEKKRLESVEAAKAARAKAKKEKAAKTAAYKEMLAERERLGLSSLV